MPEVYRFNDCVLDVDRRELTVAGRAVTMQPKAFELLLFLIRNRHRAVDKDELQDALWPRSIVTETALTRCVMKTRRAVNDDAGEQAVIKTVHGHGYRFIATITETAPTPAPAATRARSARPARPTRGSTWAIASGMLAVAAVIWWLLSPPAVSGSVRLAVLPVENATGDPELDWTRTGLMALMSRMLTDQGIDVVDNGNITDLAGDAPLQDLLNAGGEFRQKLRRTTAATHVVGARLESDGGLYRLSYTFQGGNQRPDRRIVVGQEPAALVRDVVSTVATIITSGRPDMGRNSFVSADDFINEAYARAMDMQFEGRYQEAQRLFQVIIEQEPGLFWPRYEYALAARNLQDTATAERIFQELRKTSEQSGDSRQLAAVLNSLGIMYMEQRRNDEAVGLFQRVVAIGTENQDTHYRATGNINLGLVARNRGDLQAALQFMQEAVGIYQEADVESLPGALLNNLSGVLMLLGHLDEAERHSLAAIDNFRLTGQRLYESYALSRLASIQQRQGLLDEAEKSANLAMAVRVELGDRRGTAASLLTLADIAIGGGNLTRGHQSALQAKDISTEIDEPGLTADALLTIARAELAMGNHRDAAQHYMEAEALAHNIDDRLNEFAARHGLARSWIASGDYDAASSLADELLQAARADNNARNETAGLMLQAEIAIARGQWAAAIAPLEESLDIAESIGATNVAAAAHVKLGRVWLEQGDIASARQHIDLAAGDQVQSAEVLRLRARIAADSGGAAEAAEIMATARSQAGESWTAADEARLASYRELATGQAVAGE